jgi:hypothetical protein
MRRPRRRLQVSTFPFLAVLLSAMGSLILVLLVMDRRAKQVARAKAMQALAQADAEEQRRAAERRAEWERRRQELHAALLLQDQNVQAEFQTVVTRIEAALAEVKDEKERRQRLEELLRSESRTLARLEQELNVRQAARTPSADKTEAAGAQVERLAAELGRLEQSLAAVQAARRQARQTYSVVPYRGPRGDSRRPIYVECAASGVVFHPDGFTVPGNEVSRLAVRTEVERRLAALSPGGAAKRGEEHAYLLLLVRPDGILNYYHTAEALKGLPVAFGYELVDAGWVLAFAGSDDEPARAAPVVAGAGGAASLASPVAGSSPNPSPRGVAFGAGSAGAGGSMRQPGSGQGTSILPGPAGVGAAGGSPGPSVPGGSDARAEGAPVRTADPPAPGVPAGPGAVGRTGDAASGAGAVRSRAQPASTGGNTAAHSAGAPPAQSANAAAGEDEPPAASKATDAAPSRGAAELGGAGLPGASGAGGPPDRDGTKPAPRPVLLTGDRDWIIQVECTAGAVIVHPTRLRIATSTLKEARGGDNPLLRTVQQMIDRRQASVRPGEPPYRPQVRFLVRPDGLRTFHQVYPVLEPLRLPMKRQDIEQGEEIRPR